MELKRGIFFTIDSIIATGIILTAVLLATSIYTQEQKTFHLNYLSQDLANSLSILKVKDTDNGYIKSLIADGTIKNKDNTILEQIADFWANSQLDFANKTASNITEPLVAANIGFGIWINNEAIYTRDIPLKKSLVSSKTLVSGFMKGQSTAYSRQNPPKLYEPIIIEVRVWQ